MKFLKAPYKKIIIVAIIAACLFIKLPGQNRKSEVYKQWYDKALQLYDLDDPTEQTDSTALALFLRSSVAAPPTDAISVAALIKAGNIHQGYRRFLEANTLYYQAIGINKKNGDRTDLAYEAYLYLGSSLYYSNIDSAKYYFEAASDIALNYKGIEVLPDQESLYNSLGAIYYESANYQQSKNYFEKATEFLSPQDDDYTEVYNGIQSNIANCLVKLNRYNEALLKLQSLEPDFKNKKTILHNTAHCYFELGSYDSAILIYRSYPVEVGYHGVVALTDIGRIYLQRKQWSLAEAVFDSAISLNKSISQNIKNKEEALAYHYRSQLARQQGLLDEALSWSNEALKEIHLTFNARSAEDLPLDISKTVSAITLFKILIEKAGLLYQKYTITQKEEALVASLASYRKAIETANFIKLNFDNDEAKLFFNQNYRPIYNQAITVAYEAASMNRKLADDFLFIIENYKGSILYQNLQNVALKSTSTVPESVRKREKEIKDLLAVYTTRINQNASEQEAGLLQKRLLSLQVELSRLQREYEEDDSYAAYKFQYGKSSQSIAAIQAGLDNNTALLNYYTSDTAIYCLAITNNGFSLSNTKTDSLYKKKFTLLLDEVYRHQEGKRYDGFTASAAMYKYLITPVLKTAANRTKWIIIPDGQLYYLPFDALMSDENKRDYLVLSKTISYHYSFSLLFSNSTHHKSIEENKEAIAYAPYINTDLSIYDSNLPVLPLSADEVKDITKNVFLGKKATKQSFLSEAGKYPVIHLATHASIGNDSTDNWIQFHPQSGTEANKLFLPEIYNLNLQHTELIVLSACETGGGTTAVGEGLLSLSRAFMYAGADGIVSTLWKSEDMVTAYLMQRMHQYLKQKKSPALALQLAKKDLLADKKIGSQYKSPNYWSNFVYAGKQQQEKRSNTMWWIPGIVIICLLGLLIYQYKKKPHFKRNTA